MHDVSRWGLCFGRAAMVVLCPFGKCRWWSTACLETRTEAEIRYQLLLPMLVDQSCAALVSTTVDFDAG